ncbi:MAG: geranylgeranylglycerol-phosphate geranylgeranyltransferase [Bacteroidota bacterium]
MRLLSYIHIIRPKNISIVAVSQILIYLIYLLPLRGLTPLELDGYLWILFVLDTMLIAAGGYIINDIADIRADEINKPEKLFIGKGKLSLPRAWVYYIVLVVFGFAIAFYIAWKIEKMLLLSIYPVAVLLLYLYSFYFKRMPLLGNLVVSIFCAFVPAIIWYAEYDMVESIQSINNDYYTMVVNVFIAYIVFAFVSTLVREIIKDIEDVEGDLASDFSTLPIVLGKERARVVALFFSIFLLFSYGLWFRLNSEANLYVFSCIVLVGLILPTMSIIRQIYRAKQQADYSSISKRLKYLMIASLFIFLCIPYISKLM